MYIYEVWYVPIFSNLSKRCERVKASSVGQAEIKFFLTEAAGNCYKIIEIVR
jgi:hypothetical protein